MKTAANKIADLALIKAIGSVLSEDENKRLRIYRKFQKALEAGKGDEFASSFCNTLFDANEYDTVQTIIDEIEGYQINLLEFASAAASIATKEKKDPISVSNILKVIDIQRNKVSQKTRDFLSQYYTMYLDKLDTMGEDLIDVNSANEPDANSKSRSKIVREEIKKLAQTADSNGAGYVRFVSF